MVELLVTLFLYNVKLLIRAKVISPPKIANQRNENNIELDTD